MKSTKLQARLRRAKRGRAKIRSLKALRLCVVRSANHIYAQVIELGVSATGGVSDKTILAVSTMDKDIRSDLQSTGNIEAAKKVGEIIAKKAQAAGIKQLAFDRSGYKYHGRVQALADAVREYGITI